MVIRNRYESILESFKNDYIRWYNRMVDWYGNGDYEIVAILDDGSKLIYNQATAKCYKSAVEIWNQYRQNAISQE